MTVVAVILDIVNFSVPGHCGVITTLTPVLSVGIGAWSPQVEQDILRLVLVIDARMTLRVAFVLLAIVVEGYVVWCPVELVSVGLIARLDSINIVLVLDSIIAISPA